MPNENQKQLVSNLLSSMSDEDRIIYKQVIDMLFELGYVPQKQKSADLVLDFKNNKLKEKMAKIGVICPFIIIERYERVISACG